jgi:hypothetical protein
MKQWSRKYTQCIKCNTTSRYHAAKGLCWLCYQAEYRQSSKCKKRLKEHYQQNRSTILQKQQKYRQSHLKQIQQKNKEYYHKNKEKISTQRKLHRKQKKENN